jgi:hypothetical protein
MASEPTEYERLCHLCDEELAAANRTKNNDARIEHLEQAFRFAQRASERRATQQPAEQVAVA